MTSPFTNKFVGGLIACSILISQQPVFAEPAPAAAQTFDLGSAARTQHAVTGGALLIGGARMIVRPGQALTPAEFAALQQVASTGHQDLVLGGSGAAIGGRVNVDSTLRNIGNLVISNGVSALANLTNLSALNIVGNLVNSGNVYAFASGTTHGAGRIGAANIYNNASGVISSILPSAFALNLSAAPVFDLSLSAAGDIVNSGTISSSGSLELHAGSGVIKNSGLISAAHGSVNVANDTRNVVFDNTGGTVQAVNGCINVHDAQFVGNGNITLTGGNWISQNLNLNAGGGDINVAVRNITGQVNAVAANEHLLTDAPNLVLGSNIISGDPTFVNAGGNITINGTVGDSTEAVAIIAAGDILAGANGEVVNHGFNVTLVAGAQVTVNGGTSTPAPNPFGTGVGQLDAGSTVSVDFSAGTGGNIDLSGSSKPVVIDTSGDTNNVAAGNVLLAAYANGTTGGSVIVKTTAGTGGISAVGGYDSGLTLGGNGGNVTVIAGGNPATVGETIKLNNVKTGADGRDPSSSGGNILIVTAQPTGDVSSVIAFDSTGAVDGSSPSTAITWTPTLQDSNVPLVRPNAQVHLFGTVETAPAASALGGLGGTGGSGGIDGNAGVNAGTITITAGDKITAAVINASGGGGGGGGGGSGGIDGDTGYSGGNGGSGGNAGAITISSALGDIVASTITASGGAGGGGGGGGGAGSNSFVQGFGGTGGTGGTAAQITLQAGGVITVAKLLSRGGADGGAGGDGNVDTNTGAAGGGGGGGGGGVSGGDTSSQGGGGGGGGQGSTGSTYRAGGNAGNAGVAGGNGAGTSTAGGGGVGTAFGATGGAGGTGGNGSTAGFTGNPGMDGGNRDVDNPATDVVPIVQLYGGTPDAHYLQDADYADRFTNQQAPTITPRDATGKITVTTPSPMYSNQQFGSGNNQGVLFINEGGGLTPIIGSTTTIVPAEWVAVNQVGYSGVSSHNNDQLLIIDASGNTVGGSFSTTAANDPYDGVDPLTSFSNYTLPAGVTNTIYEAAFHTQGVTTVNGTMDFSSTAATTLFVDTLTVGTDPGPSAGTIASDGSKFTIQANDNQALTLTNAGTISNAHEIDVLGAAGQDLTIQGTNGTFTSPQTKLTTLNDLFFSTGATILTFSGTVTFSAPTLNTIFIGNNAGDISLTAKQFETASGTLQGDMSNLHATGGGGGSTSNYIFPNGGTIANPAGNITLPKNITTGGDLAILASGDIIASTGVTKLTASSKTGSGHSVTMVAGFDFDGTASTGDVSNGTYDNFSPNATGGSIYAPKLAIDTSSKAAGGGGGKVVVMANAGNNSAGAIYLGALTTTGQFGGGSVTMTAGGGMSLGAINTSGGFGGSVILIGAQPTVLVSPSITNGTLTGSFVTGGLDPANGAGIVVNGAINTSGTAQGGGVTLRADQQVSVTKGINASGTVGGASGANVLLSSVNSFVSVLGTGINTSGAANKSGISTGGNAGNITIGQTGEYPTAVNLTSLIAKGGANSGTGGGGTGGTVAIQTFTDSQGWVGGPVTLSGYIDTRGGAETSTTATANPGAVGGDITVFAGLLAVKGSTAGASIIASGGAGSKGQTGAQGGNINITTYSVQQLPTNFDLTSTKKSIPVLQGGLFTVLAGAPINGTSGKIVSDGTIGTKQFVYNTLGAPRINIQISGPANVTIADSAGPGASFPIADVNNKRTLVTPAQAVALWQASQKDGSDSNTLITDHTTGASTSGTVTFSDQDINGTTFGAFKLVSPVQVLIGGTRPVLNVPAGLNLPTGTGVSFINNGLGFVEMGTGALNIAEGATLTSNNGDLALSGKAGTWNVNGELSVNPANAIYLARAATSPLTFNMGLNSLFVGTFNMGPTLDAAVNVKFLAPKATVTRSVALNFGTLPLPTLYQSASAGVAAAANTQPTDSVTFGFGGTGTVSGNLSAGSISIVGSNNKVGTTQTATSVTVADDTSLIAKTKLNIATTGTLTIGDTTPGANGVVFQAGVLKPNVTFGTTPLAKGDLVTAGTFTLSSTGSGGIVIGNADGTQPNFVENGAKLSITATVGDVTFGDQNIFRAMGGNVVVLAKGNVTGGSGNQFQAEGNGITPTGGIELTAGSTVSAIGKAFATKANNATIPSATVVTGGTPHYVLLANGNVNLGNATLDFTNKGVMTFNGLNTRAVNVNGGTFTTVSAKPISELQTAETDDFVVDTQCDYEDAANLCAQP